MSAPALGQASTSYSYTRPFVQPAPVWDYWFLLLFPLLIAICLVYKAVKVGHVSELVKQAAGMFGWIVLALAGAAVALVIFVRLMS